MANSPPDTLLSSDDSMDDESLGEDVITKVDITPFQGRVTTNRHFIVWTYDEEHNCCERFSTAQGEDSLSPDDLVGALFTDIDVSDVTCKPSGHDWSDNTFSATLTLSTDKGVYRRVFYNSHNGYYAHTLIVCVDGKQKFNLSL